MRLLKAFFLVTDIGFIVYWLVTLLHLLPPAYLFSEYQNPIVSAWNWSFLPLDLAISATGLSSVFLYQRGRAQWRGLALISLVLTFCSGLQAISFWGMRCQFDWSWWALNLYLMIYPLFFLPGLLTSEPLQEARA